MTEIKFDGHKAIARPDGSSEDSWCRIVCGYCGSDGSAAVIAYRKESNIKHVRWIQCTNCGNGSVLDPDGRIHPARRIGPEIEGLSNPVSEAYDEARDCMSVAAYTACELICRKILMYVGVEKCAKEGKSFAHYIDHLKSEGYVTPPMERWVDRIRSQGNQAAHELEPPDRERAESTLMFTAELLRLVYEMEHMTETFAPKEDAAGEDN